MWVIKNKKEYKIKENNVKKNFRLKNEKKKKYGENS